MLRIALDINGRDIGEIGVHNTMETRVQTDENDVSWIEVKYDVYDLRGYSMHGGSIDEYPKITSLWHDRSDGAAALTAAVMDELDEDEHLDSAVYQ